MKHSHLAALALLAVLFAGCGDSHKSAPTQAMEAPSAKLLLQDNLSVLVRDSTNQVPGPVRLQAIIIASGQADTVASQDYAASKNRLGFRFPIARGEISDDGQVSFDDFNSFADCFGGLSIGKLDVDRNGTIEFDDFFELSSQIDTKASFNTRYDMNEDSAVDSTDLAVLMKFMGQPAGINGVEYDRACDFNADGAVDFYDFFIFSDDFGITVIGKNVSPDRRYYLRVASLSDAFAPVEVPISGELLMFEHNIDILIPERADPAPILELAIDSLSFSGVNPGQSVERNFVIRNSGSSKLTATITASDRRFTVVPAAFSVAEGDNQTITITYTPTTADSVRALIKIATNAGNFQVPVICAGVRAPIITWHNRLPNDTPARLSGEGTLFFRVDVLGKAVMEQVSFKVGSKTDYRGLVMTDTSATDGNSYWAWGEVDGLAAPNTTGARQNVSVAIIVADSTGHTTTIDQVVYQDPVVVPAMTIPLFTNVIAAGQNPGTTVYATVGAGIPLHTEANGNPAPNITWTMNGISVTGPNAVMPTTATGTFTLTCSATNSQGTTITSWPVVVNPAPLALVSTLGLSTSALAFGNVSVGGTAQASFIVNNTGNANLTGTISVAGVGFSVSATSVSVAPGANQTVTVTFSPSTVSAYSGTISVTTTGGNGAIGLNGAGLAASVPGMAVTPLAVSFDSVLVGGSAGRSVSIQNTGTSVLVINNITSSSSQMVASPASGTVNPGSSLGLTITFTPTAASAVSGNISITSNAGNAAITATGIGKAPPTPEQPVPIIILATAAISGVSYSAGTGFSVLVGQPITLIMTATGTTPAPQTEWQVSADNGASWTTFASGSSATYTFIAFSSQAKLRGLARNPNDLSKVRYATWTTQVLAAAP